jgi:hypothetical protein
MAERDAGHIHIFDDNFVRSVSNELDEIMRFGVDDIRRQASAAGHSSRQIEEAVEQTRLQWQTERSRIMTQHQARIERVARMVDDIVQRGYYFLPLGSFDLEPTYLDDDPFTVRAFELDVHGNEGEDAGTEGTVSFVFGDDAFPDHFKVFPGLSRFHNEWSRTQFMQLVAALETVGAGGQFSPSAIAAPRVQAAAQPTPPTPPPATRAVVADNPPPGGWREGDRVPKPQVKIVDTSMPRNGDVIVKNGPRVDIFVQGYNFAVASSYTWMDQKRKSTRRFDFSGWPFTPAGSGTRAIPANNETYSVEAPDFTEANVRDNVIGLLRKYMPDEILKDDTRVFMWTGQFSAPRLIPRAPRREPELEQACPTSPEMARLQRLAELGDPDAAASLKREKIRAGMRPEPIQIGDTFENAYIRAHRYRDVLRVTDLTNAGKRGKKVRQFSVSTPDQNPLIVLSASIKTMTYDQAIAEAREMGTKPSEEELRGIDVHAANTKKVDISNNEVSIYSDPTSFIVRDLTDKYNEPTVINTGRSAAGAARFFKWISEEKNQQLILGTPGGFRRVQKELDKLGVKHHYYCAVD